MNLALNFTQPKCGNTNTGSANITVTGGAPPYEYHVRLLFYFCIYLLYEFHQFNDAITTDSLFLDIPAGDYTFKVSDSNLCTKNVSWTVLSLTCNVTSVCSLFILLMRL